MCFYHKVVKQQTVRKIIQVVVQQPIQMDKSTKDNINMVIVKEMVNILTPMVMFILVSLLLIKRMESEDWSILIKVSIMDNGMLGINKAKGCIFIPIRMFFQEIGLMARSMGQALMSSMPLVWSILENGFRINSLKADGLILMALISKVSFKVISQREEENGIHKMAT